MSALVQRQEWENHALCREVTDAAEVFFSEDLGDIAAAKRVANPGCYALASVAMIHPLVSAGVFSGRPHPDP